MGRKRRRKQPQRPKTTRRPAPKKAPAAAPARPERSQRLWLVLGAAGLFFSGSLIGSVVGTQIARQDFEVRLAALERPAPARPAPGMWRREPSKHALSVFLPARPGGTPEPSPAPDTPPQRGEIEGAPEAAPERPSSVAKAGALPEDPAAPTPAELAERPASEAPGPEAEETPAALAQDGPAGEAEPPWRRHAVQVAAIGDRPAIAIVLDDLALNLPNTRKAITLPGPLSLAFMTYGYDLQRLTRSARDAGHELLVHMPMEPQDSSTDPGPNVLTTGMAEADLAQRVDWGLSRFEGFVGVNNHMGSRFTASAPDMARVMAALKRRGLLFLDSQTVSGSVGGQVAAAFGVPFARRDIFIDNTPEPEEIQAQLAKLERLASRRGYAVGIGHPYGETLKALEAWIPEAKARGFVFVPISNIAGRAKVSG